MPQVFLSYRRQDNDHALSIYLWLIKRFGRELVFWDRKDIDPGRDFAQVITESIDNSAALIALIGKDWVGIRDAEGRRKIDSGDDWVRHEIVAAFRRGIPVFPVLGSGAVMPKAEDLPQDIDRLARLQALSITDMRFYALLAESLAAAGIHDQNRESKPASREILRAGTLLKRQAERLQIRAKELIREGQTERALEELNEGTELMMALLDFVPGEQTLDVQLGFIYGALAQEFEAIGNRELASRYRNLQLGILERVQDDLSTADYGSGDAASAIKGLGEVYAARGDYDRAIEFYRKSLEIEPTYQYAWHDLFAAYDGLARAGRIDLDQMRQALDRTRQFSAGSTPGTQVPGLSLEYLDSMDARVREWEQTAIQYPHMLAGAEERYSAAIAKDAKDAESHYQRGLARAIAGDRVGAIEDYSAAIAFGKDDPRAFLNRGILEFDSEDWRAAENDFTAALARGSETTDTYFYRGRCRLNLQEFTGAESDLSWAIEHGQTDAVVLRGGARIGIGDFAGAELDLSKAIELHPEKAELYEVRALARQLKQDYAGAANDYAAAIAHGSKKTELFVRLGAAQARAGQAPEAEENLTRAIEAGSKDASAYFWRGKARLEQQNFAVAEADFNEAIQRGYEEPEIHYERGNARLFQGNTGGAGDDFTTAVDRGYTSALVFYLRAIVSQIQGNYARAFSDCSNAIERGAVHADVFRMRAYSAIRLGKFEQAEEDCTKAKELQPEHPFPEVLAGDMHLGKGEFAEAASSYRSALLKDPQRAWPLGLEQRCRFALGLALLLDGRPEEAEAEYSTGMEEFNPFETEIAMHEIDHWTRDLSVESESLASIRRLLVTGRTRPAEA